MKKKDRRMAISVKEIKTLRDAMGASIGECKIALVEADGDFEEAKLILRKKLGQKAGKRGDRATAEGFIGCHIDDKVASLVEVQCETDFVGRNQDFRDRINELAKVACALEGEVNLESLNAAKIGDTNVENSLKELIGTLGENMRIGSVNKVTLPRAGAIGSYVHNGLIAVLVALSTTDDSATEKEEFKELLNNLCLQVCSEAPQTISSDELSAEQVEKERVFAKDQMATDEKLSKLPEQAQAKILEGKINKYFEGLCLLNQPSFQNNKMSIEQVIKETAKKIGTEIKIEKFVRVVLGGEQE
jgi:elongation factor Ts